MFFFLFICFDVEFQRRLLQIVLIFDVEQFWRIFIKCVSKSHIVCHTNIKCIKGEIAKEIKYTANFPGAFIGIAWCYQWKTYTCETQTILHRQCITHGYCSADKVNVLESNCFFLDIVPGRSATNNIIIMSVTYHMTINYQSFIISNQKRKIIISWRIINERSPWFCFVDCSLL